MKGTDEVTNREDIINSRDIIDRIAYLEDERSTFESAVEEAEEAFTELVGKPYKEATAEDIDEKNAETEEETLLEAQANLKEWDESEEGQELKALKALQDEAEGYSEDWRHGAALIRDTYFKEYAEHFADDIGAIDRNASWPVNCIDWEKAADELKTDYTSVDFDGVEYWVR